MTLLAAILTALSESVAAISGLVLFVLLLDEYRRRRGWRLNLTATASLAAGLSWLALLGAQSFKAYSLNIFYFILRNFALVGLAVAAWWLATALITTYVHRLNRRLVMAAVLAPAVIS
ncbi:MAG: hypothetical protein PHT12_02370, partial [Patescibacteria group bacterium]|nr:hypothetical protein [Patescibacteria group bacterium]